MNPKILESTANVPEHQKLLLKISSYFQKIPGIVSLFVSGSTATGGMDEYSDLDLGFLCRNEEVRNQIWNNRWNWGVAPWFHRFDADHIKPNFVIYFFEPNIHVDFNFYVESDLPPPAGGPFVIAWDETGKMESWAESTNQGKPREPDWSNVVHEDEQFWAWIHYSASHAARGEFYDTVRFLKDLRSIVENWEARLAGRHVFDSRRAEERYPKDFLAEMARTFCTPSRDGIKNAFASLIRVQLRQRSEIGRRHSINWKVSDEAIAKIRSFAEEI